jgi:hypothetical protein
MRTRTHAQRRVQAPTHARACDVACCTPRAPHRAPLQPPRACGSVAMVCDGAVVAFVELSSVFGVRGMSSNIGAPADVIVMLKQVGSTALTGIHGTDVPEWLPPPSRCPLTGDHYPQAQRLSMKASCTSFVGSAETSDDLEPSPSCSIPVLLPRAAALGVPAAAAGVCAHPRVGRLRPSHVLDGRAHLLVPPQHAAMHAAARSRIATGRPALAAGALHRQHGTRRLSGLADAKPASIAHSMPTPFPT